MINEILLFFSCFCTESSKFRVYFILIARVNSDQPHFSAQEAHIVRGWRPRREQQFVYVCVGGCVCVCDECEWMCEVSVHIWGVFPYLKNWRAGDLRKDGGVPDTWCIEGHWESWACFAQSFNKNLLSTYCESELCWLLIHKDEEDTSLSSKFMVPWERQEYKNGCIESKRHDHTGINR